MRGVRRAAVPATALVALSVMSGGHLGGPVEDAIFPVAMEIEPMPLHPARR